jgi:hypothetical protein
LLCAWFGEAARFARLRGGHAWLRAVAAGIARRAGVVGRGADGGRVTAWVACYKCVGRRAAVAGRVALRVEPCRRLFAHVCLVFERAAGSAAVHVAFRIVRARAAGVGGAGLLAAAGGDGAGEAVREARHVGERARRAARALDLADESGGSAQAAGGACNAAGSGEVTGGAQSQEVHSIGLAVANCARHETCTRNQHIKPSPTQPSHSPIHTTQHAKIRKNNKATRTVATSEDRDSDIRQ